MKPIFWIFIAIEALAYLGFMGFALLFAIGSKSNPLAILGMGVGLILMLLSLVAAAGAVQAKKEQLAYTASLVIVFAVNLLANFPSSGRRGLYGWFAAVCHIVRPS